MITQAELNDIVRYKGLRKNKAEFLGLKLQEWIVLVNDVRISLHRDKYKDFIRFYKTMLKYAFETTSQENDISKRHLVWKRLWKRHLDSKHLWNL